MMSVAGTISDAAPPAAPGARAMPSLVAVSLALLLLYLAWAAVDVRTIAGDPVWLKPTKFALSFVVTFGTLALIQQRLSPAWAEGWVLRIVAGVMAAAFAFEMAYMTYKAARGLSSHFNTGSALAARMYQLMGIGALALVVGIGTYGAAVLADRQARMSPALRTAAGVGLLATMILTLITAGTLGANGSHFVGQPLPGAGAIPFLGWSGSVGDLRPSHFLALHAMQALPLYVLWRERRGRAVQRAEVGWAAGAWTVLTLAVFAQALAGYPLVAL
jgi:hypothetical protein